MGILLDDAVGSSWPACPGARSEIVGRDEPLARLESFVADLPRRPARMVIEGEAGIGKTTVWRAGVDAATSRGYHVLVCRPAEAETRLAYSGLADLLGRVEDRAFDGLPEPQRRALDAALLRCAPTGRAPEARAIFTAFGGVVRALARDVPVVVAVDDRQWLDASSARALEYVARRLVAEPVGMLTAQRTPPAPAPSGEDELLRLGPLTAAGLHRLLKAQTGVSLSRPAVLRVHRMTGGNPFFALQLVGALVSAGLPDASEPWPVPEDLRGAVAARLDRLPTGVRSALLAAAASARPTIAGLDASAVRHAEAAGIVTVDRDGRVRFAHPLFASAIYSSATPHQRRRVHVDLAVASGEIEEQARHRSLACDGTDEDVALLLDRAAAAARGRGAPDIAAELAERAVAFTPPHSPGRAWRRRLGAAEEHFHAGDLQRARTLLVELVETACAGRDRSVALRLLGETSYRLGDVDYALGTLRRAVDAAAGDAAAIASAELAYAFVVFFSFGSFEQAAAAVGRALGLAEMLGDDGLLSGALALSVVADAILGRGVDEERLQRSLVREDHERPSLPERRPSMVAGIVWMQDEQLGRARAVLQGLRARLLERGEDSDLPGVLVVLAQAEWLAGNLPDAGELADRAYELAQQARGESLAGHARAIGALVHAHMGHVDETRTAAAEAIDLAARSGWQVGAFHASVALGHLHLALGDDAAVVATLERSIQLVEQDGVIAPFRRPFLPDAIEALVHLGDLDRAGHLTKLLDECARALRQRAAILSAARCCALIHAARGDVEAALAGLDTALTESPSVPMPLDLARALIVKGQLERRRKHRRHAAASLGTALDICERIGARLWAERARSELARLGARADGDALTATEAQVARLAASGLTNRQVAAAAFLSPKTVEANISRIYRKLGIHSRAELGARLADHDPSAG